MKFRYRALQHGKKVTGEIEASSERDVSDYLRANGFFPIEITEKKESGGLKYLGGIFQGVGFQEITYMTRQFAIMLDAGLTLIDSLEILKKQAKSPPMRKMLESIDKSLRDGKTFSQALELFPRQFSHFYIALVKSGEASGKLDSILTSLAEHMEKQREFRQKIRNALIYPSVIVTAMLGMIFVMFAFVMPQLLSLYDDFDVELPQTTIVVKQISDFLAANWLMVLVGVAVVAGTLYKYKTTKQGSEQFDRFMLKTPVFGNIIRTAGLVDATRTLSILISSGVPILDGLVIVIDVNSNIVFKEAFTRIKEKVEKGLSIGTAMANETIFPESLTQMAIVGEQTGHLDVTLSKLAEYYQTESEMAVKGLLTLMEPAVLVLLGVTVGFIVMAVITPIFSLTNSLGG